MKLRNRVKIRPATPNDLGLLRRWDEQPHVVASNPNDDWRWEAELARSPDWRELLIAELDGRPIGFIQIIDPAREETHYWSCTKPGRRAIDIWIGDERDLGRGYGTEMMKLAIERCFADPTVTAVLVDPRDDNARAHRFYERLGFEYVAQRDFQGDRCVVYRLPRGKPAY
jgi:aminoglycoside 6'-N-acetyltransferase